MTDLSELKNLCSLETKRLILRRLSRQDAQDMFEYARDPEVTKYLLWHVHPDIRHTVSFIASVQRLYRAGTYFDYAVILKSENKMIGTCGFAHVFENDDCAEIGYVINPAYQGNGYASEAAAAVIRFGICNLGFHRIEARYMVGNDKSRAVMEKCGMRFEGINRGRMLIKGKYTDIGVCAVLNEEFKALYGDSPALAAVKNGFWRALPII